MSKLYEYVMKYADRGACTCGRCFDAPENPEQHQPEGHTVNLTFFKVALRPNVDPPADKDTFHALAWQEFPDWFDGAEHSFLETGADMGDQGIALMTMGLGHLLGVWNALSPDTVMPFLDEETKRRAAGGGMVTIIYKTAEESEIVA